VAQHQLVSLERSLVPRLLPLAVNAEQTYQVRRGFIEAIWGGPEKFLQRYAALLDLYPVRAAFLETGWGRPEDETLASPELMAKALAQPRFRHLVGLSVRGNQIGDAGLARLAAGEHLQRLRWLNVEDTGVTADGIEALAASGQLPDLQHVVADRELCLVPEPGYDYDGSLVYVGPAPLRERLAARYDRAWLRRELVFDGRGGGASPWQYDEV
jgi:hypothetical protein